MKRLIPLWLLALLLTFAPMSFRDDGSGARTDDTQIEQIYGDTAR